MVLLDCLVAAGFRNLVVCHLDHRLRGRASTGDARFVEKLAGRLELPCVTATVAVRELAKCEGLSLETAARRARRSFFAETAKLERCARIFLAHHAEDQAETVLMNLARGCGLGGLAGMSRASRQSIDGRKLELLRPLLGVRRVEIDAWILERGLKFREDATNADADFGVRNAVRQRLLPMMDEIFGRDVAVSLGRLAGIAGEDAELIESHFADLLALADGEALAVEKLVALPPALRRRVILEWLRGRGVGDCGVAELRRVESLLELPIGEGPAKVNLPSGWHARRRAGLVFLDRSGVGTDLGKLKTEN